MGKRTHIFGDQKYCECSESGEQRKMESFSFYTYTHNLYAIYNITYAVYLNTLFKHNDTWNFKYKILNPDRKAFEPLLLRGYQCFGISCATLRRQVKMI